jgi:hypothetical protein
VTTKTNEKINLTKDVKKVEITKENQVTKTDIAKLSVSTVIKDAYVLKQIKWTNSTKDKLPTINTRDVADKYDVVANKLQSKKEDTARCAGNHLLNIIYDLAGIEAKNAKDTDTKSWVIMTKKGEDFTAKLSTDKMKNVMAFGFKYDSGKKATYFKADADIDRLAKLSTNDLQNVYNDLVSAAERSHTLNSHNNQFSTTNEQPSSWLNEINTVMNMVIAKQKKK